MSVADRLNKLTTDITNAYTSIENKDGTIPANKNTNNLSTAIDSIEVIEQATAEGENLSLTNTKAMPYKDYIVKGKSEQDGTPSPSNPVDINSVADDVNLLNVPSDFSLKGFVKIPLNIPANTPFTISLESINLGGEFSSSLSFRDKNEQTIGYNVNLNPSLLTDTREFTSDVASVYIYSQDTYNNSKDVTTTYTKLMIKKGTEVTPYSPYNQGTVTIKQRGKNLLPNILEWKYGYVTSNGSWSGDSTHKNAYSDYIYLDAGTYTISYKTATAIIAISKYDINKVFIERDQTNYSPTTSTNKTFTLTQNGYIRVSHYDDSGQQIIENINSEENQIEEGSTATDYEPYQGYDKVLQTEPLRSLPNGVKDTIEEEQHRRILQVDMGELTWVYSAGRFYANDVKETIKGNSSGLVVSNIMCDTYNAITPANWYAKSEIGIAIGGNGYGDAGSILVYDSNYTSKSSFETAMQGHYLICELAEEIIEPLTQNQATTMLDIIKTGSYEGTTNIYTDEDVKPTIGVGYYKKK